MKYILVLLCAIAFSCADDECDDARSQYEHAKKEHAQKMKQAGEISDQLELFDKEDTEQMPEMLTVEDDLNSVLIDIAFLEIEMEQLKSDQFKCF